MQALIIGMGIGELYRSVYTDLGWNITTCDTAKPADFSSVEDISGVYDIAHVCTPNFTHETIARQIAPYCKVVFVEKPGVQTSALWESMCDTFPETKFVMVKNNQFRDNVDELRSIARGSDYIECNWINQNRVPHPGSWFTTKKLAFGGVSRDLMPHLLSWVQVLDPIYDHLDMQHSESHQHFDLDTLTSTDYGVINPNGTYDVDDECAITLRGPTRMFSLRAAWKSPARDDDIALYFYKEGKLLHKEPLGLCPESAYKKMVDEAYKNMYNESYWKEQQALDVWIHSHLQGL